MRTILAISILIFLPISALAATQSMEVSMVSANSIDKDLPFKVLMGGKWRPEPGAEYVKIHIFPDKETVLSGFEVESCEGPLKAFDVYVNFDEVILYRDMQVHQRSYGINEEELGRKLEKVEGEFFDNPTTVRSITFNFEKNVPLCLSGIRLFGEGRIPIPIRVPRIVEGTAVATSTLDPVMSYDVMNLFDSRFEYAWASNKQPRGVEIKFSFSSEEMITRLMIWNGYQRSDVHCQANSRVKLLRLEGGNGYAETVPVLDKMGAQIVELPKPFKGSNLTLTVVDAYEGNKYKDLVISELRFFDGNQWFMLNPIPQLHKVADHNREQFEEAKIKNVLNRGLAHQDIQWELRLRADGSFYANGIEPLSKEGRRAENRYVVALGNYELLSSDPKGGVRLRLFGVLKETVKFVEFDCNGCGRDCNTEKADPNVKERIFQQFVRLKHIDDRRVQILNDSPSPKLKFKTLELARK